MNFIFIASFFLCTFVHGAVHLGQIVTKEDFKFVARFGFDSDFIQGGDMSFEEPSVLFFKIDDIPGKAVSHQPVTLAVYPEEYWFAMQAAMRNNPKLTCLEKLGMASKNSKRNITQHGLQDHEEIVEHYAKFWYITLFSCYSGGQEWALSYNMTFINPPYTWWNQQFGYDQLGLLEMYLFYWIMYSILMVTHLYGAYQMVKSRTYHPVVKTISAIVVMETVAFFFKFCHFASYAGNGIGAPQLDGLAQFLDMICQTMFICLLLLLAQGYAITTTVVPRGRFVATTFGILFMAFFILFIWQYVGHDPASASYVYDSFPGWIIILLRVGLAAFFVALIRLTYREESHPSKRNFYLVMGSLSTLWFFMLTLTCLIAYGLPDIYREKAVFAIYDTSNFVAFATFVGLMWPTVASTYFKVDAQDLLFNPKGSTTGYDAL